MNWQTIDKRWRVLETGFLALVLAAWFLVALQVALGAGGGATADQGQPTILESDQPIIEEGDSHIQIVEATVLFGAGGKIEVGNTNGKIAVSSWDRDEVRIKAEKRVRLKKGALDWVTAWLGVSASDPAETARRLAALQVEIRTCENEIHVASHFPQKESGVDFSVDYELCVPRSSELDLRTVNGSISLQADVSSPC